MRKRIIVLIFLLTSFESMALEVKSLDDWFSKGRIKGNFKYYFIETNKENDLTNFSSSAYSHSIGGKLNYSTANYKGLSMNLTFMSTNPFALPDKADTSTIARDDGVRIEKSPGSDVAKDGFSILGESFLDYKGSNLNIWIGRKAVKTPLINAKDVRMIPTSVSGANLAYKLRRGVQVGVGYVDKFKQRTSSKFINIIEHTLGSNTKTIIGKDGGFIIPIYLTLKEGQYKFNLYDYYAENFMNSLYSDFEFRGRINSDISFRVAAQGVYQQGVGRSCSAMNKDISAFGGEINSLALGLKAGVTHVNSSLSIAYTKVKGSSNGEHNSLVMPWDGTPLFTNTVTSSNLFGSNYGKGLSSTGGYIAGTQGVKISYLHKYKYINIGNFKSMFSYSRFDNSGFDKTQVDLNAVLSYSIDDFTLDLKGIWVSNGSSNGNSGTQANITQLESLAQYRVIANYKF